MAVIVKQFTRFEIAYHSLAQFALDTIPPQPESAKLEAQIFCSQEADIKVALIRFYDNADLMPTNEVRSVDFPVINYHIDRFKDIYNMMLNERPLEVRIDDANKAGAICTTEREDIGEQDPGFPL